MGPDLAHFHAANRDRAAPADGGGVEWLEVMQALEDVGYQGYVTMEIGFNSRYIDPDALARRSLTYLKSVEAQLH
jgi:protein FrlC